MLSEGAGEPTPLSTEYGRGRYPYWAQVFVGSCSKTLAWLYRLTVQDTGLSIRMIAVRIRLESL